MSTPIIPVQQTELVAVSESDVALVETLSETAVRSGHLPIAIQGFALTKRLRAESGLHPKRRKDDPSRNVTDEAHDPRDRFGLYRLCDCNRCDGKGKVNERDSEGEMIQRHRCPACRGEGRVRQEVASCESPEAVGVALVTLGREQEWEGCAFGLLDRMPECETCNGRRYFERSWIEYASDEPCNDCKGSGVKPSGTWILLPWLPSPRNASDAGKLLRSRRKPPANPSNLSP